LPTFFLRVFVTALVSLHSLRRSTDNASW
jgi:hypothetical protein